MYDKEYVIENQGRVALGIKQKWLSPYLPGDRPHYSVEKGWEYTIDFLAGLRSPNKNVLLHNVRRRKFTRVRKMEGLLKRAKNLKKLKK